MSDRQLRYRAYIHVGTREKAFDPAELTRQSGVDPTTSWQKSDLHPKTGRPRKFDYWEFEPRCDPGSSTTERSEVLYHFAESKPSLLQSLAHLEPVVQYVIETGREPTEFTIGSGFIKLLTDHRAEIDCDLYWICAPSLDTGICANCRLKVPSTLAELRPYIGGEACAAELQIKLALFEISNTVAARFIDGADENTRRLDYGLDVVHLPALNCVQFCSDFVPASGSIEDLLPERWTEKFLTLVTPYLEEVGSWSSAELMIRYVERGDFQGTAGLHFDDWTLKQLRDLSADLSIRLEYIAEPLVQPSGACFHCSVNLLEVRKTC